VVDYLLKPIDHAEFARALQKAKTALYVLDTVSDTQKADETSEGETNRIIRRIKELVQQNLDREFTLQNVSEEIKLNYNYLSSLFKEKTGMNFTDFLTEARMKKALILLKNSTMKTYEIAELCGYSNSKYFSTVFKKNKGKTPAEYRQST
jgi:two-component system response regulator YesN